MAKLLAALATVAGLIAAPVATPKQPARGPADVAMAQGEAVSQVLSLTDLPLSVDLVWLPCGQQNAFYYPGSNTIVMCLEMTESPGAESVAAHEAGHAMVYQLGLPIDDDPYANERAADEIGTIALIEVGELDEAMGGAKQHLLWAQEMADDGDDGAHASFLSRAREIACLVDGAEDGTPECIALYHMVRTRWLVTIADAETHFVPVTLDFPE